MSHLKIEAYTGLNIRKEYRDTRLFRRISVVDKEADDNSRQLLKINKGPQGALIHHYSR